MYLLEGSNITKTIDGRVILNNIDIKLKENQIISILGPSGVGKTTLLRLLMGLEELDQGKIYFKKNVLNDNKKIVIGPEKRNFSLVFQDFTLFPHLSVTENVTLGLKNIDFERKIEKAQKILKFLHIDHLSDKMIDGLSGGELQRISLARSIIVNPEILFLDEPFSNIDRNLKEHIYREFKSILVEKKIPAIIVTHNAEEAFYFSDYMYILNNGKIVAHGKPQQLYFFPPTAWVASLLGDVNEFRAEDLDPSLQTNIMDFKNTSSYFVRPEQFLIHDDVDNSNGILLKISFMGAFQELIIQLNNGKIITVKDFSYKKLVVGNHIRVTINDSFNKEFLL